MALLKHGLLAVLLAAACAVHAQASDEFLSQFDFSGFIQGRATTLLFNKDMPQGALNDLPSPDRAGGEASTQALIKRLEFNLNADLPWAGWSIKTTTGVGGSQTVFKDIYLAYQPVAECTIKLGQFRVPFGVDPQISSGDMELVERPLIYSFGNFGWVAPLGMEFVGERDYGLRADWVSKPGFANFAPIVQAGVLGGNGHNVQAKSLSQVMARMAVVNQVDFVDLKNNFTLGFSGSYGANRFIQRTETYSPIGSTGDMDTRPDLAVRADNPGGRGTVAVWGVDASTRMDNLVVKGEAVSRQIGDYAAQGYYATAIIEFGDFGVPLDLTLRWDEAIQGYADGSHLPNVWYQAYTAGLTWHPDKHWRVQANYIVLLLDNQQHVFPGSDLFILQVQWNF
jgi:hypothetical protein